MKLTTGYKKPIDSDGSVLLAGGGHKNIQLIINDFGAISITPAVTFNLAINADILGNATTADRLKNDVEGTNTAGQWNTCKIENGVIKYYDRSNDGNNYHTITLNGGTATTSGSISWYAPTSVGSSGLFLKSNGSGAPTWVNNPNTDANVKQSQTTTANWRPVVLGAKSNATKGHTDLYSDNTALVYTTNILLYQPSTGTLSTSGYIGSTADIDSLTAGNLVVSGSSSLGTVTSGTWNGNIISKNYLEIPTWSSVQGSASATSITNIPITHRLVIVNISASASFTLSNIPSSGHVVHVIIKNTGNSAITITIPNNTTYINCSDDTIDINSNEYAEINCISDGNNIYIRAI